MKVNYDKDVTLSHISALHSTIKKCWDLENFMLLSGLITSTILSTLFSGLITVESNLTFSGINLIVPLPIFALTGSMLIGFFFFMAFSLQQRASKMDTKIRILYSNIDYDEDSLWDSDTNPFYSPLWGALVHNYGTKNNPETGKRILSYINNLFLMLLTFIYPLATQIYIGISLINIGALSWWGIALWVISVIMFVSGVIFFVFSIN